MPSFNLTSEPWLPCTWIGRAGAEEVSLQEALLRAHEVRELGDPSPLVTVALHRLLLAAVHRVYNGPPDVPSWERIWRRGAFDAAQVRDYLDRWRDRFDLFADDYPFYQVAGLSFEYEAPISRLVHEAASGNNPTLFDHSLDSAPAALSPAQAARYLVAQQAFGIGGLVSFEKGQDPKVYKSADNAPLVKGAVALVKGPSLFHTLLLNLHRYNPAEGVPFAPAVDEGADGPAWEAEEPTRAEDRWPRGYLDLLTWQSRRVRLHPELDEAGRIVVRRAVIMKGYQFPDGFQRQGRETMLAFTKRLKANAGEDPWPAVAFEEGRALWRDSLSLLQSVSEKRRHPQTLAWLGTLVSHGAIDRAATLPVDFCGLATDRAKVLFWRHERLPVPAAYLQDDGLVGALDRALALAEKVAGVLQTSARTLAQLVEAPDSDRPGGRRADPDAVRQLAQGLAPERRYWPALEVPFRKLLLDLPADRSEEDGLVTYGENRLREWAETLGRAARTAFSQTASGLDGSPRTLKAVAVAEGQFHRQLGATLKHYAEHTGEV